MKKYAFTCLSALCALLAPAQPRPFEIDPSFAPPLEFMQKSWTGQYDGLESNSKMILSLSRSLVLHADLTYLNEVTVHIKDHSGEVLLRHETGTYQYNSGTHAVIYTVDADSTLDINSLLKGEELTYAVGHYKQEGKTQTSTETAQFTYASSDDTRQWVSFDPQLMSPIDPRQRAVYVMSGKEIETSAIHLPYKTSLSDVTPVYDLSGCKMKVGSARSKGIYIVNGAKIVFK